MKFLGQEVDAEKLLKEIEFILNHCDSTLGITSDGKYIDADFGYVKEFFEDLLPLIK